jgi:hypothetical protein
MFSEVSLSFPLLSAQERTSTVKLLMDKTLRECVEQAYEETRLGRGREIVERDRVFGEVLAELEIAGDAMRYVNAKGQIAWRATERLRDYIEDLWLDSEAEFEQEII